MNIFDVPITPSNPQRQSDRPSMSREKAIFYIKKWVEFAERGIPFIKDSSLLPVDKLTLLEAFEVHMNFVSSLEEEHESIGDHETAKSIHADFMVMLNDHLILERFTCIQDADKEAVKYFNQFGSYKEIPEARQKEFSTLMRKYERLSFEERSDER